MNRCKVGRCSWNRVTICSLFAKRFMFAEVGIAASQSAVEKVTPWNCIKEGPCPCRCPCPCPLLLFVYSLTEVYFLGFSWTFKRVYTENTHKAWSGFCGRPARDRSSNFKIHRGFSSKSIFISCFITGENFSLEKQTVFSLFCIFLKKRQGFSSKVLLVYWFGWKT